MEQFIGMTVTKSTSINQQVDEQAKTSGVTNESILRGTAIPITTLTHTKQQTRFEKL